MTTAEPMDVQTWLNRQNDQLRMQRTIESITPSQEDLDHEAVRKVERTAEKTAAECHETVSRSEDQLLEVSSQARSLRGEIMSGAVSRDDAVKRLQDLHKQRDAMLARINSAKRVHAAAAAVAEDPANHVAKLRQRFPSLNG
jgi:hypothetical protein